MPDSPPENDARIELRSALSSLIQVLTATDPLDWAAANALLRDVEHRLKRANVSPPADVLDPLRAHLHAHEPFDGAAAARQLQRLHDSV